MLALTKHIKRSIANAQAIILEYNELLSGKDLHAQIEKAYGPQGLSYHK